MAKVKITGHASGTGVITITAPNTSTDRTITLPDGTGTLLDENSSLPAANLTGTIASARIADDAVTAAKLANSINTEIDANTAKVTNYNQTKADIDTLGISASSITGALPAIDGASLTGGVGLLVASGSVNGGVQSPTSASAQTHTVFTFTMPANKTKVVISGSWSYYTHQSNNGWCITRFEFTTNAGSLTQQASQWDGERKSGSSGLDNHGGHAQDAVLTGVSAGTSVTISLVMTPYNSATSWGYYQYSQCTAIAY
jgi:hypothetical protein